jgi:hypothetical protein
LIRQPAFLKSSMVASSRLPFGIPNFSLPLPVPLPFTEASLSFSAKILSSLSEFTLSVTRDP